MSDRTKILDEAKRLVSEDRAEQYGPPEESFRRIAAGWSIILGKTIEPFQVALCMDWLKTSRAIRNPTHTDSWVDKAGYAALGAELAQSPRSSVSLHIPRGTATPEAQERIRQIVENPTGLQSREKIQHHPRNHEKEQQTVATVLYGDYATGKTYNAKAIAKAYGCRRILDDWSPNDHRTVRSSDLLITLTPPNSTYHRLVHIDEALRKIGKGHLIGKDMIALGKPGANHPTPAQQKQNRL